MHKLLSLRMFSARSFWQVVLIVTSLLALCYGLFYQNRLIAYPQITEYREFVVLQTSKMFAVKQNPFSIENYPATINVHGFMHGLISGSFCRIFGNCDLSYHKIFSAVCILLSTVLIIATGLRLRSDKILVFSIGIFFYCLCLFSLTALPRPDALGLFFFLLAVLVPVNFPRSIFAITLSIFAGVFGTLTKLYFVLSFPLTFIYLVLFVSVKRGVAYLALAAVATFGAMYVVKVEFPTFFLAMSSLTDSVEYSVKHLTKQLIEMVRSFISLLVLWLIGCYLNRNRIFAASSKIKSWTVQGNVEISMIKEGNFFTFFFLASILSFISFLYLGLNTGAYMLYLYQLFIPFLLLLILADRKINVAFKYGLLSLAFITLFARQGLRVSEFDPIKSNNWNRLDALLEHAKDPIATPLSSVLVDRYGRYVYLNGHNGPLTNRDSLREGSTLESKLRDQSTTYFALIEKKIESGAFDLIVCDPGTSLCKWDVLTRRYDLQETFPIYLPHSKQKWDVSVYRPKNSSEER